MSTNEEHTHGAEPDQSAVPAPPAPPAPQDQAAAPDNVAAPGTPLPPAQPEHTSSPSSRWPALAPGTPLPPAQPEPLDQNQAPFDQNQAPFDQSQAPFDQSLTPASAHQSGPIATQAPKDPATSIGVAFANLWLMFKLIIGGHLPQAHGLALSNIRQWLVSALMLTLGWALFFVFVVVGAERGARSVIGDIIGFSTYGFGSASFGDWLMLFLIAFVFAAAVVFMRITFIWCALKIRKVNAPFSAAGSVYAAATTPLLFTLALVTLLVLIPTTATFGLGMLILVLIGSTMALLAELAIYVGINRLAPMEKSPIIPHVFLTLAWWVTIGLFAYIMAELIAG